MAPIKIFSLEEANKLLPDIAEALKIIFSLREEAGDISKDIDTLFDIWGDGVLKEGNSDHTLYTEKLKKKYNVLERVKSQVKKITATGALVKDLNRGLIDFYAEKDAELIFLCWKYGEDEITHWHTISEGFSGRKEISLHA